MPTNGLESGAFEQGILGANSSVGGIDPTTGLPVNPAGVASTPIPSDASFNQSPAYARDVSALANGWFFPTYQHSLGENWTVISQKLVDGTGAFLTPYVDGTWTAIFSAGGFVNVGGNDFLAFSNAVSGVVGFGPGQYANPLIFNFISAWTFISYRQYFGFDPPKGYENAQYAVAKWGANAFSMRPANPTGCGVYKKTTYGFPSTYNILVPPVPPSTFATPTQFVNAIGGYLKFKILSADLSTLIDLTPGPNFIVPSNFSAVYFTGSYLTLPNIDSVALLGGRFPFFPVIEFSSVTQPGNAPNQTNPGQTIATYGGVWNS